MRLNDAHFCAETWPASWYKAEAEGLCDLCTKMFARKAYEYTTTYWTVCNASTHIDRCHGSLVQVNKVSVKSRIGPKRRLGVNRSSTFFQPRRYLTSSSLQ